MVELLILSGLVWAVGYAAYHEAAYKRSRK